MLRPVEGNYFLEGFGIMKWKHLRKMEEKIYSLSIFCSFIQLSTHTATEL